MAEKLILAKSAEEAVSYKCPEAIFLAGGTEINRLGATVDAETLISIKRAQDLKVISEEEGQIRIGVGCTFTQILEDPKVPCYLKKACRFMAAGTKRNMATIGGNVALLRSDSYIVPTLIAAGAQLELMDKEKVLTTLCIEAYQQEREKYENRLITAILLPEKERTILSKRYANTAESHAVLTVSVGASVKPVEEATGTEDAMETASRKRRISDLTIAAAVKNGGIYSLSDLAVAIEADPEISEEEILNWVYDCKGMEIIDDVFGTERYKRYLLGVTVAKMARELQLGSLPCEEPSKQEV